MIWDMTPDERCAYDEGVKAAIDAARIAAISIECAEDAGSFRKRIVAEALAAFAEAARYHTERRGGSAHRPSEHENTTQEHPVGDHQGGNLAVMA